MAQSVGVEVEDLSAIRDFAFFADFTEDELVAVASRLRRRRFRRGEVVYHQEDQPGSLYLVTEGRLKVCLESSSGRQFTTNWIQAGSFFGLISVLDQNARLADAVAIEPSELLVWRKDDFYEFLLAHPNHVIDLMEILATRWRSTMNRLYDLAFLDVPGRLAKSLLQLGQYRRFSVDSDSYIEGVTHAELASLVGTSRESISRWMRRFRRERLITMSRGAIRITDERALAKYIRT